MLYVKNYKNKIFYIGVFFTLASIYLNFNNYIGSKVLFLIYNLSSLGLFLTIIRKKTSAFEFFFGFFLLLSFWFKFSCILYFNEFEWELEGNFDLSVSNYDKTLIVIIFSFIAFIVGSFLRETILNKIFHEKKFKIKNYFLLFYKKFRFYILSFFIFSLIIIYYVNFNYNFYNRGSVNENIPIIIRYFFSWLFTYGLSVATSLLIYIDYFVYKNNKYFLLGVFETISSNITIFSRAFFISIFAYLRGFLYVINLKKINSNTLFLKTILPILVLLFLSFHIVTQLRNINFVKEEYYKPQTSEKTISEFLNLSVNRWVGIDALLSVSQNKNIGFDFFMSSLHEKKQFRNRSFYIDNFYQNFKYSDKENLNVVITPGLIPFLYYTGSVTFVFISMIIIILFCSLIEKLFFLYSAKNQLLINIIGYAMAVRAAHFGYLPYNTINYLLSIFLTLLFVYILSIFIWKKS